MLLQTTRRSTAVSLGVGTDERRLRILVVDDDEDDYVLTADLLSRGKRNQYDVTWASTYEAGLEALKSKSWDVCLLDYRLGAHTGTDFLREIQQRSDIPPTILLSGVDDPTIDEQVLHCGAADYLVKGQVTQPVLEHSIRYVCERHRAANVLLESEEVLRATLDALTSHLVILDRTGRIIATNAAWNRFAVENGCPSRDFGVGSNYLEVCRSAAAQGDESVAALVTSLEQVLEGSRRGFSMEYACFSPTEERWFTVNVLPWGGTRGTGAVIAHVDVTAPKRAEKERAAAERRFRTLIENSADHLFLLDSDGRTKYVSPSAARLLGYTVEELASYDYLDLVGAEDLPLLQRTISETVRQPAGCLTIEHRVRHKSTRQPIWWECVVTNRLADPDVGAIVVNSRDVTERRQAAVALRESDTRYRELFESATDLIFTLDLNKIIDSLNPAAERAFGYSGGSGVGQRFLDLLLPEYRAVANKMFQEKLTKQSISTVYELELLPRAGQPVSIEMNTTLLYKDGNPVGVLGIGRDITQRRRSERFEQERRGILEKVAQHFTLTDILTEIAGLLERQYPGSHCSFQLSAELGLPLAYETDQMAGRCGRYFSRLLEGPEDSAWHSAAVQGKQVSIADVTVDWAPGPWRTSMLERGFRACWATPLLSAVGRVLGTLAVCLPEPGLPVNGDGTSEKAAQLAALTIEHRLHTDQLAYQAQHDSLTGLPNRSLFHNRLMDAIEVASKGGTHAAVLYLDLDNFKRVNDSFGHHAGDTLLVQVVERIRGKLRPGGTMARLGGDEFAMIIPGLTEVAEGRRAARDVMDALRDSFVVDGQEVFITASIGLSMYPSDGEGADTLLQNADTAMYGVKTRGKNGSRSYSKSIARQSRRRTLLQSDLHRALDRNEFHLAFQSQINVKTGGLTGFEVLLRWKHSKEGFIPPSTFIPLAEDSGLIVPIGRWVLEQVCRQGVQWQREGRVPVRLAVNVSALQFSRHNWPKEVNDALVTTGFTPGLLDLELTETLVMRNVRESVRSINTLRSMGVGIAIDDFGTGYSSLAYLERLPIDRLKIDVSFVQAIRDHSTDAPLIRAIITLAHTLGIQVVAEGVETQHQLAVLGGLKCDEAQGYLFSRPVMVREAAEILQMAHPQTNRESIQGVMSLAKAAADCNDYGQSGL